MPVVELPYDIWLYITNFLDAKDVQRLYPVNKELFHIVMGERYRHACIGFPPRLDFLYKYAQIRDTFSAVRVRQLTISYGPLYRTPSKTKSQTIRKSFLGLTNASVVRTLGRLRNRATSDMQNVMNLIPSLTSVHFLEIRLNRLEDPAFHPPKVEILKTCLSNFGPNLTTLILNTPMEDLRIALVPLAKFPRLESLFVDITLLFRSSDGNALVHEILHPFIVAHRDTLRSLTLEQMESIDMSTTLSRLPHMPCLTDFCLSQAFVSVELTNLSGHRQFLARHRDQLRQLDLHFIPSHCRFPSAEVWYAQEWTQIRLTELESLAIGFPLISEHCSRPKTIGYLYQYVHHLTSLNIRNHIFSYDHTVLLLSGLQDSTRLRRLDMRAFSLSPDILRLLAEKLHDLHFLSIRAKYSLPFKDILVSYNDRAAGFCLSIENTIFPVWKLHTLVISPKTAKIAIAVLSALPALQILCGEDRDDIFASSRSKMGRPQHQSLRSAPLFTPAG
ncbi:hypothetical protein GALMADRAFT_440597 [Galerina marginata CBS 339.88]|uniref:F-box domain-containing protein n=1 Tax=Galerina marginata (strain CBS 339.88) TaxID=685588 RepID=A0A067T4M5_GALM3|nr:hypothetical protein GALMADRAFT_440597 [Galerina marginata CBS 339.88]